MKQSLDLSVKVVQHVACTVKYCICPEEFLRAQALFKLKPGPGLDKMSFLISDYVRGFPVDSPQQVIDPGPG